MNELLLVYNIVLDQEVEKNYTCTNDPVLGHLRMATVT